MGIDRSATSTSPASPPRPDGEIRGWNKENGGLGPGLGRVKVNRIDWPPGSGLTFPRWIPREQPQCTSHGGHPFPRVGLPQLGRCRRILVPSSHSYSHLMHGNIVLVESLGFVLPLARAPDELTRLLHLMMTVSPVLVAPQRWCIPRSHRF
ncbi:hypothetical protein BC827DRAFT_104967 [Russula dissimulans]|nr:hypothetical protein BC827DRAFT_104967 [Russula dissimulans]